MVDVGTQSDEANRVVENAEFGTEGTVIVVVCVPGEESDGASAEENEERTDVGVSTEPRFEMFEAEVVADIKEIAPPVHGVVTSQALV